MAYTAVVTDSTADLDPNIAAVANITVVPASIHLGLGAIREAAEPVWTAEAMAPPEPKMVEAFVGTFRELAAGHNGIVAVLLSRRLGSAVDAALAARDRVSEQVQVEIVDSRSASLGLGFQVLRAKELAEQGLSAGEIVAELAGRHGPLSRGLFRR